MVSVINTFSMTIQNIEDVMDRIMSLNRNLTEDSLRTLLSASGWDKEDIVEGLRLFKMRSPLAHSFANTPAPAPAFGPEAKPQQNYSFNIKKQEEEKPEEIPNVVLSSPVPVKKEEEIKVIVGSGIKDPLLTDEDLSDDEPKKSTSAKIFSIILVLVLVILALVYFFPSYFLNTFNKVFVKNNTREVITYTQTVSTSSADEFINSSSSLAVLLQEVSNLRDEFNTFKAQNQSSKTIVKYISQRGPTGKAGRGVSSVSATSTGFVINYTDNTSIIIPYSTTTIINILNSNSVCFRDVTSSSTQATTDVCLDRNTVSKIIASSTSVR